MKFYITYFYNIRFLPETCLPVSTAMWDPAWYKLRDNQVWKDKRGVWNGFRMEELHLPENQYGGDCSKNCPFRKHSNCLFLRKYAKYLQTLDWDDLMRQFNQLTEIFGVKDICLMVHEKPDNTCSERKPLVELFKAHGIELTEFYPQRNESKKQSNS